MTRRRKIAPKVVAPKPKPPKGRHSRRPLTPPPDTSRDEMIERALGEWIRLGSSRAAAAVVGVDDQTIRGWKVTHPDVYRRVEQARAEAVREIRGAAAADAAEGMRLGAAAMKSAIEAGGMEPRDLALTVRELRETDAHGDRIARLDAGQVTERVGIDVGGDAVDALNGILGELKR